MIGDAFHNLRAALDLLACDLVRLNGKRPNNVYFPFASRESDFEKIVRQRNMHKASPDVLKLLRSLKPYKGGNEALRAIHDMDVLDKHQALIPVAQAAMIPPFGLKIGDKINPIPQWDSTVTDGHTMVIMPALAIVPIGTVVPSKFRLTFAPDVAFAGREIVPTLHDLTKLTDNIVQAFEALCLRCKKG